MAALPNLAAVTPLDVAAGGMIGVEPRDPLPRPPRLRGGDDPIHAAFRDVLSGPLETGRCLVSFSGGRDSSGVLARVVSIARAEGLPDPIPVSLRFAGAQAATENEWQEDVIGHLGLKDWERIEITDELELIGPVATSLLRRHGLYFPASAHMLVPMLERARGGTLVVGQGGQEIFLFWRWGALMELLLGHRRPQRKDVKLLAALLPPAVRGALARRSAPPAPMPWLRPDAARRVSRIFAHEVGTEPVRWNATIRSLLRHRCYTGTLRTAQALAEDAGAAIVMPNLEPRVAGAWAAAGGARGWGDRDSLMRTRVGGLLPERVLTRKDSARFGDVFFGTRTREFAASWSGGGLDESLVDPEVLRGLWLGGEQNWRTALPLQAAWLHDDRMRAGGQQADAGNQPVEVA